jgi:hypothetical protein
MTLQVGGRQWLVAQMGPDFLILTEPSIAPPGQGVVTLTVDGRSEEIPVLLPHGMCASSRRVEIAETGARVAAAA